MGRRPGSKNKTSTNKWAEREQEKIQRAYRFRPESLEVLDKLDLDPAQWQRQWRRTDQGWQTAGWQCLGCHGMFVRPGAITNHPEKCRGLPAEAADDEWLEMRLRDGTIVTRTTDK